MPEGTTKRRAPSGVRGMAGGWLRAGLAAVALGGAACSHPMLHNDIQPPPAAEFGYGPRVSAGGLYQARIEPQQQIRIGQLHAWKLEVRGAGGVAVTGAVVAVDGGMPQHGHGLPTRPRVERELGDGWYEVQGMRFNMGGWWVVEFRIQTPRGTDVVTFNLSL